MGHSSHSNHGNHSNHSSHNNTGPGHNNSGTSPVNRVDKNTGSPINLNNIIYEEKYFLSNGTFTPPAGVTSVQVLVVAGGGGGGSDMGGGGGGGGVVYNSNVAVTPGVGISVVVGAGGAGAPGGSGPIAHPSVRGSNGGNSSFGGIIATGGGGGGTSHNGLGVQTGLNGGSGGGASGYNSTGVAAGTHKGGTEISGQGFAGGNQGTAYYSGGGGGAGGVGTSGNSIPHGGPGIRYSDISPLYWGGGGGGSGYTGVGGNGGIGGGGGGAVGTTTGGAGFNNGAPGGGGSTGTVANKPGGNGGTNTGGGGGGGSHYHASNKGGNGGSGIVIVKWVSSVHKPWTNWSSQIQQDTYITDGVDKVKELRDKLVYLQAHKGQYTVKNSDTIYVPNNPAINVSGANDSNFASGIYIDDVVYDTIKDNLDILKTHITGSPTGLPAADEGTVILSSGINALKAEIDNLAQVDVSTQHASHSNHANHSNHGSHASSHASSSDKRLKKNIIDLESGLDIINKLHSIKYKWIDNSGREYNGFIAQEIEKVFPQWVIENKDGIKQIVLGPLEFESILVKAIQEQQEIINKLLNK